MRRPVLIVSGILALSAAAPTAAQQDPVAALKPAADRPAPLYLRGPDAKIQTGYALART